MPDAETIYKGHYRGSPLSDRRLRDFPTGIDFAEHLDNLVGMRTKDRRLIKEITRQRYTLKKGTFTYYYNVSMRGKFKTFDVIDLLTTARTTTDKGLLFFMEGENFSICCLSHFFERLKERGNGDDRYLQSLDKVYDDYFGRPFIINSVNETAYFTIKDGFAVGEHHAYGKHNTFIIYTYLSKDMLFAEQKCALRLESIFRPQLYSLRNIKIY